MKIGLVSALSCLVFAGSAQAQTLFGYNFRATDTTPWAGPYVGIHGGYALDEDNTTYVTGAQASNQAALAAGNRPSQLIRQKDGYVAGVQSGWNVQAGRVVLGLEGDFSATDFSARGHLTGLNGSRSNVLARDNYLGSERGRVGFVAPGGVLLYGTGGYASSEIKDKAAFLNPQGQTAFYGSHEYKPSGWVAGAGFEYALPTAFLANYGGMLAHGRITTGVEWLHYDLGDKTITVGSVGGVAGSGGGYAARFTNQADVVRARVNYRF
jgi:outer membrane immunogenic protein